MLVFDPNSETIIDENQMQYYRIYFRAVCKIDSVKTNIRGNLNQIRNLFKS